MPSGLFLNGGGGGAGGIGGTGTAGVIAKFSGATTLANSLIQDDGTNVSIGAAPAGSGLIELTATAATSAHLKLIGVGGRYAPRIMFIDPVGGTGEFTYGASLFTFIGAGDYARIFSSTDPYLAIGASAAAMRYTSSGVQGLPFKDLTESSATAFVDIAVAAGASCAGIVEYEIFASDGTDHQSRTGSFYFNAVNKAGTLTIGTVQPIGTEATALSSGTLANTFTATAGTGLVHLNANAVSSLTQTTLRISYRVFLTSGIATVAPL